MSFFDTKVRDRIGEQFLLLDAVTGGALSFEACDNLCAAITNKPKGECRDISNVANEIVSEHNFGKKTDYFKEVSACQKVCWFLGAGNVATRGAVVNYLEPESECFKKFATL